MAHFLDKDGLARFFAGLKGMFVQTVNGVGPDANGNVNVSGSGGSSERYDVGDIYISTVSTSPASKFGGSWMQIEDTFLLAAGTSYAASTTGGSSTIDLSHTHTTAGHQLTLNEMPSHTHSMNYNVVQSASGTARSVRNIVVSGTGGTTDTNSAGGNQQHYHGDTGSALSASQSIMPPFLAVYMWERVA